MPLQKQIICVPGCAGALIFIGLPITGFCLILDWLGQFLTNQTEFVDIEFIIAMIFFGIWIIWIIIISIVICMSNKNRIENKTIENTNKQVEIQIHK